MDEDRSFSTCRLTTSDEEMEERIESIAALLGSGAMKSQVKKQIQLKYGCSVRTCETYLSRARVLLIEQTNRSKAEHFTDAAAFYLSILQSNAEIPVKIKARERLDQLYGLDAKHGDPPSNTTNTTVNVILSNLPDDELAALYAFRKRVSAMGGAAGVEG